MAAFAVIALLTLAAVLVRRVGPAITGSPDPYYGPSASELQGRLATELPAFVKVQNLQVQASENVGDQTQPLFKTRFQATIELTAPTFRQVSRQADTVVVRSVAPAGTRRTAYGLAVSRLNAGAWSTTFRMDNDPLSDVGKPRDFFSGGRVVAQGSAEEAELRAEKQRQEEAAQAAAREQQLLAEQAVREEAERHAEIGRRQSETQDQLRRQALAQLRAPITTSIRTGRPLLGEVTRLLARPTSFRMRFTAYEEAQGTVRGTLDYGVCVTRFEGTVANEKLVFTETDFVRPSRNCEIGVTWRLRLDGRPWEGEIEPRPGSTALNRTWIRIHVE